MPCDTARDGSKFSLTGTLAWLLLLTALKTQLEILPPLLAADGRVPLPSKFVEFRGDAG